ncbi:MAG: DNA alkylation repair protein [archaeon]
MGSWSKENAIKELKKHAVPESKEGMTRFGIEVGKALGVAIPHIRAIGKEIGRNHEMALELWNSGIHEARMLACFIDEPKKVKEKQLEEWVKDFDSWDLCDQCCSNLFDKTGFAYRKAFEWSSRKNEFEKRAGFVMMACLSVHDKKAGDKKFIQFLPVIKRGAGDERNFVKKAVNWALRQIGKRNTELNKAAFKTAREIQKMNSRTAKWIASDAIRELEAKKDKLKK